MRVVCYDSNSLFWSIGSQRPWLERVLRERKDKPFLVVCAHHPVYSGTKNRFNLLNNSLLGPLFRRCGVDLVLAGHDHIFAHDRDADGGGPHYIGLSTAHKTYSVQDPERHVASSGESLSGGGGPTGLALCEQEKSSLSTTKHLIALCKCFTR